MYQANQRVGEYVLDELVGQSAFAQTWRAHHHAWSDQEAMVKIPTDAQYIASLRQEGIKIYRLVHPSILRPIGFDPKAEPPYLITEYVKGESLRAWIGGKRLTMAQSVNVLRQVLAALQFGHERQVVHGDIKPENILLDASGVASDFATEGSVKVTDFGIGLAAAAMAARDAAAKSQQTGSSLAYVAPEQRDGAPPDAKSDIYAVGIVLFEMLTGDRPTGAELPSELNPLVPSWMDDVFRKSYARRERRFESARAFLDALAPNATPASPVSAVPSPPPRAAPVAADPGEIRLRTDTLSLASPATSPPQSAGEQDSGGDIALAKDEDYSFGPPGDGGSDHGSNDSEQALSTETDYQEPEPSEVEDDQLKEEQQAAGADTAVLPEEQGGGEPVLPSIPKVASPADQSALFDELNKRQVRTPDELRNALKGYFEMRDLDTGESANIRLRLLRWAAALAGGKSELDDQVLLLNAAVRPLYVVKLLLRSTRGDEEPRTQAMEHPIADKAASVLRAGDYRLIAHFSATALNEKILEAISSQMLRAVVMNLTREARREFFGRIQREDLLIFRANVITASYRFDQKKYRAFLVGNALSILSVGEPFTRIRQEPTKRAAALLNGEQIFQGIKELRRALDEPQWEAKGAVILNALRGKLAAAYMAEARSVFKSFGWLESLEFSAKAGQLVPGHEDALSHAALVRKRVGQLQLLPGTLIGVVLIALGAVECLHLPFNAKEFFRELVQYPLLLAGIAAWIAAIWSKAVLKTRMARTDFAFYQAAVFPLLVAVVVACAPSRFADPVRDAICGVLLVLVIVADVVIFKNFRRHLMRQQYPGDLAGDAMTALARVETMIQEDWEKLKPHYLDLGPLFSYTTIHVTGPAPELFDSEAGGEGSAPDDTFTSPGETRVPRSAAGDAPTGNEEVDRLMAQMNGRISASLRTLAPTARVLLTIFGEYSKSVSNRQIGMMQANAGKLEQKGKELAAKLADFDRLCRTPLSMASDANAELLQDASARLAEHSDDPDIKLLKSLAERASNFREDQAGATADIQAMVGEVEAALERLKK